MKKKSFKQIRDIIYNNPRADRQDKDNDDKIEDENKRLTLYDENDAKNEKIRNKSKQESQKFKKNMIDITHTYKTLEIHCKNFDFCIHFGIANKETKYSYTIGNISII